MSEVVSFDVEQVSNKVNDIKLIIDEIASQIQKLSSVVTAESERLQDSFSPFVRIKEGLNQDLQGLKVANEQFDQIRMTLERYAEATADIDDASEF